MTNSTNLTTVSLSGPEAERAAAIAWDGLATLLQYMHRDIGWQNSLAMLCRTLGEMSVAICPGMEGGQVRALTEMLQKNLKNGVEQRATEFIPPAGTA